MKVYTEHLNGLEAYLLACQGKNASLEDIVAERKKREQQHENTINKLMLTRNHVGSTAPDASQVSKKSGGKKK